MIAIAAQLLSLTTATNPPDTNLATLPVVYYGANWNRTQENLDVLARFEMVILMQEDGHCWATCCPDRFDAGPQCGPLHTATDIPGCNASCVQHGAQSEIFTMMKAAAAKQKRRPPHAILYMNRYVQYACRLRSLSLFCVAATLTPLALRPSVPPLAQRLPLALRCGERARERRAAPRHVGVTAHGELRPWHLPLLLLGLHTESRPSRVVANHQRPPRQRAGGRSVQRLRRDDSNPLPERCDRPCDGVRGEAQRQGEVGERKRHPRTARCVRAREERNDVDSGAARWRQRYFLQ